MMHYGRILAVAVALPAISASPAPPQYQTGPPCFSRDILITHLASRYGEALTAAGISSGGLLVEVYVSQVGSWTITASPPTGQICVLATGVEWRIAVKDDSTTNPQ